MLDIDVDALKENFNCNGFIVLRDYLSLTELNELRDRALPLIERLVESGQTAGQYSNLLNHCIVTILGFRVNLMMVGMCHL